MLDYFQEWFWERSGLLLATAVLGGLVSGWFLPASENIVTICAMGQIIMAVVVAIRESGKLAQDRKMKL